MYNVDVNVFLKLSLVGVTGLPAKVLPFPVVQGLDFEVRTLMIVRCADGSELTSCGILAKVFVTATVKYESRHAAFLNRAAITHRKVANQAKNRSDKERRVREC